MSQGRAAGRHTVVAGSGTQVPTAPGVTQLPPLPHGEWQQTPSTQDPLAQSSFAPHAEPSGHPFSVPSQKHTSVPHVQGGPATYRQPGGGGTQSISGPQSLAAGVDWLRLLAHGV